MFQIKLEFFRYSVIIFRVFWVMSEKFLSKFGNYFSQNSSLGDVSKHYEVHTAHTLQSANNIVCKAHHIKF